MYGFHHRAVYDLPDWTVRLTNLYWHVRMDARNAARLRKHYRAIRKERLLLVEAGIDVEHVNAVCKYLVSLKQINADRLHSILNTEAKQLSLNFKD